MPTLLVAGDLSAGDHFLAMQVAGQKRSYLLHLPPGSADGARPLVLALHGAGWYGAGFAGETHLSDEADRRNVIVAYPDGTGEEAEKLAWNAQFCCGRPSVEKTDDVRFLVDLIDEVARLTAVDQRRVYATGMSNGGMMSYRLAAERPDRIAAIAPVAGAVGGTSRTGEYFHIREPARPIPVMIVHGRKDMFVLYGGGSSPMTRFPQRRNLSVADALTFWTSVDRCTAAPVRIDAIPGLLAQTIVGGCAAGAEVVLWELIQGEHAWPAEVFFPGNRTVGAVIFDFLLAHAMP